MTLVEMLIVVTIVLIMVAIGIGAFNSIGITNKGGDAQRKKDLWRIKIAFEDYFNDKGFYPQDVDTWNIKDNCGKNVFAPYMTAWPCDPNGAPYKILIGNNKFRVLTNLANRKDPDIPTGWYDGTEFNLNGWTNQDVNFGVSSTNILWYDGLDVDLYCDTNTCLDSSTGQCKSVSEGCSGGSCYFYDTSSPGFCTERCKTTCCGTTCGL